MDGESFDETWPVPLVAQPTGMSCWAASAAMVVAWRDSKPVDPVGVRRAPPGAYEATPGAGSQYVLTGTQFMTEYEAAADVAGITIQILHAA